MGKVKTFVDLLLHDRQKISNALARNMMKMRFFHLFSDKAYLKMIFKLMMGQKLNLKNPQTFSEKLQWLKLYNRKPEYNVLVDKYAAKEYISLRIGEGHTIPTLGVYDKVEDIDFDVLPNRFVLKSTHDSGGVLICKDKSSWDKEKARKELKRRLRHNFFYFGREWPYKDVKPRIIAEEYMEDSKTAELRDYKFFCFNGEVRCLKIDFDRFVEHRANYYDPRGNLLDIGESVCPPDKSKLIEMPENLVQMITYAEKISDKIPFLRVDFYEVNGKVYCGELTFFPASGLSPFLDEESDRKMGEWLNLDIKASKE